MNFRVHSGILSRMNSPPFDFAIENYPLAPLTIYRVGGPARLALVPRTVDDAVQAYEWVAQQPGKRAVLGGGSNVLIDDAGYDGIVIVMSKLDVMEPLGADRYRIESGVDLDQVVREVMLKNNYAMVGGLTGIPGTVGGAIYMNAGTVNGSTCMLMESVEVIGPEDRTLVPMTESLYSYRGQTFCPRGSLILQGYFKFTKTDEPQQPIYDHYIKRRLEKQPQGRCCGSVFKNPPGDHSGRLVEACGLKGTRHGGAVISAMHANFIMNEDNASSADIRFLINLAKATVKDKFGIDLEEEVVYIR
jgi:UDP-N-acetylmuramate dehydrogenase